MIGKAKQSPRVTPNRKADKSAASSSKKVTPTGKSPLKLKNLVSVTPTQRNLAAKEEKTAETPAQMESRIRCELRLEMLVRMREMQDYYESKIADLTEAMDSDSYTLTALCGDSESAQSSPESKVNPEILEITRKIEEAVARRDQLLKQLDEKKRQNVAINQEIESTNSQNAKLIEQRNGLQMRVDALKKQKQDEDLKINAAQEEQKRFEFLEKESKNETAEQQQAAPKVEKKEQPRTKKLSKSGENANPGQVERGSMKRIPREPQIPSAAPSSARNPTDTVGEFNQKPYRMKITPVLVHKAKHNKA